MVDVGVKIGNFRVIEHIGRGGMADVWSARDESLGRMVAIKTILRNLTSDNDPVALFEREAKTIANLEHPHILPIYGFGDYQGRLYIAMRFVTGGSLEEVLRKGAMTYTEAMAVGRAMADALNHAHSENVVHLDLKPPNMLLDSKGAPYLGDFGLATVLGPEGRAQNPGSGTLLYMAPEQLTSDELDHRVDVYSFALVIFHMLTGTLPFEATMPLALKQLQFQEQLPHLGDINADLPNDITDILRRGTATDPNERYSSVIDLIRDVEEVLGTSVALVDGSLPRAQAAAGQTTAFVDMVSLFDPAQVELQEAKDIYERARQAWANGSGRFLLSVTHFMVMSDFYTQAEKYDLTYDNAGVQVLLRGAIEYNYHLDIWWNELEDNDRRWVCLHAVRSETPQARIRAFYRLETLPDADPPQIPRQVGQALSVENDEQATLAALQVLSYRGRLMSNTPEYNVKTAYRGRLLDTVARESVEISIPVDWKNVTYSQEIDTLVAEIALDGATAQIRATAARAIGLMGSARAVRYLVDERSHGRAGALQALAYILDEVPTLPKNIGFVPRFLAWFINTGRRLTEDPMQIVWAFVFAMLGGWIGMGQHIFRTWRFPQTFFESVRVLNTLAGGLFIGFMCGVLVVISMTLPSRLRGFWPNWTRAIWSVTAAYFLGQTLWWTYGWMYLNLTDVPRSIIIATGIGTALGLVLPTLFKMRGWVATLLSIVGLGVPLYIGASNYYRVYFLGAPPHLGISETYAELGWILVYDDPRQMLTIMLPLIVLFSVGFHFPALITDVRDLIALRQPSRTTRKKKNTVDQSGPKTVSLDRDFATSGAATNVEVPKVDDEPIIEEDITNPMLKTAQKPQETLTEEFAVEQVGSTELTGTEEDITNPMLETAQKPQDALTEEFEVGQVGGADKAEADTDWDAIMSPLNANTEEFEVGQVGGKSDGSNDNADNDDDDDPWDAITKQLDDL